MITILEKIIGDTTRVKIMRLFLFHQNEPFDMPGLVERLREKRPLILRELNRLIHAGFVKKKVFFKEIVSKKPEGRSSKGKSRTKKVAGWILNGSFPLLHQLQALLIDAELINHAELSRRLQNAGRMKLIILSGVFIKDEARGVDLLLVGDRVNKTVLDRIIHTLEAEIGRELKYALFTSREFSYRVDMYDKLIRDTFDYPHHIAINTLGVSL